MEEIKELLENDSYFQGKEYLVFPIQKWNKSHKFLLEMQNTKYLLIIGEKNIQKYKLRFLALGNYFKQLVGFKYINDKDNILLLDYYGNGEGKTLSQCNFNTEENELIADKLKILLDSIHQHKSPFINFSTRFENNTWYEFIKSYMKLYADYALEQKDLTEEDYYFIFQIIEKNKPYFDTVPLHYLHGGVNEDNVCFNENTKELYLIDYDDFLVGDILYEYARIFQYENIPAFQILKNRYYEDIENNEIFLIYTLRNWLLCYCFESSNQFEYKNSSVMYHNILKKLKKINN